MRLAFQKRGVSCLQPVIVQVQNLEQTQEVRIPEGGGGEARILGTWGQVILRSKQWQSDRLQLSGGIMAWVLYETEEGSSVQLLDSWIPFQMEWDLPDECPDGTARIQLLLRSLDARWISAGKLLIRAGVAALAQCWCSNRLELGEPGEVPDDVELLTRKWPVRLPKEAGEKPFQLEERVTLPPSVPGVAKLLHYRMEPVVMDKKVLGNKLVFRGNSNLHILYSSEDGIVHGWDFELPFSQYAELGDSHSTDAQADVMMAVTRLELDHDGEGGLNLRAGMTGQYLVDDRELLETVEDAYSLRRELQLQRGELSMPAVLDSRRENMYGEQTIPIQADMVADTVFLPDFPRQRRDGDVVTLEQPATMQILYYDPEGKLQSATHRWESSMELKADSASQLLATPSHTQPQFQPGRDSMTLRAEVPVQVTAMAGAGMPVVTELELGEQRELSPGRPSLILRRMGKERLWDVARESGSTMEAIRQANSLEGEPEPGKVLLIPVV